MPSRLKPLPPKAWAGVALIVLPGLLLLVLELYVVTVRIPAMLESRRQVLHTYDVITTAQSLRGGIKDAERAQRGYLITSDRKYLNPYGTGVSDTQAQLARLKQLTADNAAQQPRLAQVEKFVAIKLSELARTIEAHDAKGFAAAREIVLTHTGMDAMQVIIATLNEIIAAEHELLKQRTAQAETEERQFARSSIIAGVLALAALVVGAVIVLLAFGEALRAHAARAESDRKLREQQRELAQYQKMEAIGQLTGGIAHDFNNLVHVIKNALEIVKRRLQPADPEVRKYLEMAGRNADRAASLTQRLLAYSRSQVLDPKPLDPNALLADVSSLVRQATGESISIETVRGAGAWWILADGNQLETAILNLALNARDAMPAGGKLTIEVSNAYLDEDYAALHAEVKPGQYVMIAVSDTGAGMTKEVAARAFDPFFTTKETGRGTGLGLSQVFGFAKQSNGHVKIYSEPGQGTTVKLYLPRVEDGVAAAPDAGMTTLPPAASAATILVVEDDADVRTFTTDVLASLGYKVLTATDADSALRTIEAAGVDLLFTDIGLPNGMNGRQLADEAQRRRPELKVLFTTGYTRNAIIHHGRLDAGVELLTKPYTQSSLAAKVLYVLAST